MSRIFVKNLPLKLTEKEFVEHFAGLGPLTDVRLLHNKNGEFRRLGIIGFKTNEQAKEAIEKFNNSYIRTSKISVTEFVPPSEESRPRPWSKYSEGSSAYARRNNLNGVKRKSATLDNESSSKRKRLVDELIGDVNNDTKFKEFVKECQNFNETPWADTVQPSLAEETVEFDKTEESSKQEITKSNRPVTYKISLKGNPNLINYRCLRAIITSVIELQNRSPTVDHDNYLKADIFTNLLPKTVDDVVSKLRKSGIKVCSIEKVDNVKISQPKTNGADQTVSKVVFELKLRGLPFKASEKDVKTFFSPVKVRKVKIIRDKKGCNKGLALVHFDSEKDLNSALSKNKCFLFGRYVELFRTKRCGQVKEIKISNEYEMDEASRQTESCDAADSNQVEQKDVVENAEPISESGCIFIKNIWHDCTEAELRELLTPFGPIAELTFPISKFTNKNKGFAIIVYTFPHHAVEAFNKLNNSIFQGRIIRIEPGRYKSDDTEGSGKENNYKARVKKQVPQPSSWNSLFVGVNVVADKLVETYGVEKREVFFGSGSLPVRLAIAESKLVSETRKFLEDNGVNLDSFGQPNVPRSDRILLVKNLPVGTTAAELKELFANYGEVSRLIFPPKSVAAIVEFERASDAKEALKALSYTCFREEMFYLEWAPINSLSAEPAVNNNPVSIDHDSQDQQTNNADSSDETSSDSDDEEGCCLYVKNLNFQTTEASLKDFFSKVGKCTATIAIKKDATKNTLLSMGYGFVKFKHREDAKTALKTMQNRVLDDHALTLQLSDRKTASVKTSKRKKQIETKQTSSKICVRNVPFQVNASEIRELFGVFGELKSVRLPKKATGGHRGFAFVDFVSKNNAKKAFKALCQSTHLFGRRLVLEWAKADDTDVDELRQKTARYFESIPAFANKEKKSVFINQLKSVAENKSDEE